MSAERASGPTEDQVEILEYNFNKVNKHPDATTLCLIAAEAGLSEEETQVSAAPVPGLLARRRQASLSGLPYLVPARATRDPRALLPPRSLRFPGSEPAKGRCRGGDARAGKADQNWALQDSREMVQW